MCSKRLFVFALVLVLGLAQVFAWPTKATSAPVESVKTEEKSANPSLEMQNDVSTKLTETSANLENKVVVAGADLNTLKSDMVSLSSSVSALIADNRDLQARLAAETGTKYFMDFGMLFGFKEKAMKVGAVGEMGIRFGKGLLVKTGIQYSAFEIGKIELPQFTIDDLSMTLTVGWEW